MKTKSMNKWIVGLIAVGIVALASAARAQTNLSFLTSKAALRAYAVEQANVAMAGLNSPSQTGNQVANTGLILPTNHTSADILRFYTNQTFGITVLNPKDWVTLNAWVLNSDGDVMLWGYSQTLPVLSNGHYSLPAIPSLTLSLNSQIPVKFTKQVSSAEIIYTDPVTGQTYNYQQLYSYGNKIYFPTDSAGDGFLQVNFTDGTRVNFDLRNGGLKTTGTPLTEQVVSATIDNLLSYSNPTQIIDQLQSQDGIGENRTYEVIMSNVPSGTTNYVTFSVSTTDGYYPRGVWIQPKGSLLWSYVPWGTNMPYVPVPFVNGTWYMVPDWDPSQFAEPAPYIYNGGGVGVGEKG